MSIESISLPLVLSVLIFSIHLIAYGIYAVHTLRERIRPNAASWSMWLFGGVIEYLTYDAIDSDNWFSSSLPFACVIGLAMIFTATVYTQYKHSSRENGVVFHKPKRIDYFLMSFDASAGLIWIFLHAPAFANMLAVSSSIVTFIPIWRTTLETAEERPLPWFLWSVAYAGMALLVYIEGGVRLYEKLFYPLYYFFLHIVVLLLCYPIIRSFIRRQAK